MTQILRHKGYYTIPQYSAEDECFFGKIIGIKSCILFEAETAKEMKQAFQNAVEDYLNDCKEEGVNPEKPYKGNYNVRIGEDLHAKVAFYAQEHNTNLNAVTKEAIEEYIKARYSIKKRKNKEYCAI